MDILKKIVADKRVEIEEFKKSQPLDTFIEKLGVTPTRSFKEAIGKTDGINIIAELKRGSPSKGILKSDFNPVRLANMYRDGGAAALSVLTESKHFFGRHEYMHIARRESSLPVLCKDFLVDSYQIYYARLMSADAVLLIAALLTPETLSRFLDIASQVSLDVLVEVHNRDELQMALDSGARIIGVNCRNLKDFSVDLAVAEQLATEIPSDVVKVAESGIHEVADIQRLRKAGYDAFLIGEALMTSDDPTQKLRDLQAI